VKKSIGFILLVCTSAAIADTSSLNLNIPNTSRTFQQDRIRAGNVDCSMAIGSATTVEFGVVGIVTDDNNPYPALFDASQSVSLDPDKLTKDVGVYGKITIPIGAPKERINCNRLYRLEIEKKELELQRLRQEIVNLKKLEFEN
jgi:hypothetical protein